MNQQQLLLRQELTISQILRIYGKRYRQIQNQYSDGYNGRCAIGVLMSYFGWDGRVELDTANDLIAISDVLNHANIDYDLLIDLNDSGHTFEEIADYLDRRYELPND
ncbi:MAG: hypothetical protein ACM3X1_08565 [Ignavibacteriales bacterium]